MARLGVVQDASIDARFCVQCGAKFAAVRSSRRIYCRQACRQAAYYHRQRAELADLRERAGRTVGRPR
jgi:hypothetical protein